VPDPITQLPDKVRAWLKRGGIPLEYEAARVLARSGFDVAQGRGYEAESESGITYREIDVEGTLGWSDRAVASIVVECKHTTDKPWVVLTNKRRLDTRELLESTIADDLAHASIDRAYRRARGRHYPEFLRDVEQPGFSVAIADDLSTSRREKDVGPEASSRDDRNRARDAMAQAVGAAGGVLRARGSTWAIVWPVVLIDGPLFALDFTDDGQEELHAISWKRILWYASPYGSPVAVDIVQSSDFARYGGVAAGGLSEVVERLAKDFAEYWDPTNQDVMGYPKPLKD
jgi:hypothetical protein